LVETWTHSAPFPSKLLSNCSQRGDQLLGRADRFILSKPTLDVAGIINKEITL